MAGYRHIGLMVESLSGYGNKILTGISRYASRKPDWRMAFFDRERKELAELVGSWQGDGIICTAVEPRFAEAAKTRKLPIVNVTSRLIDPAFINVVPDDLEIGRMAAKFLLSRGFKSFAFVRNRDNTRFSFDRGRGFAEVIHGTDSTSLATLSITSDADDELAAWLGNLPRPLAVLSSTDRIGAMVLEACWQRGFKVPEEVAVLGVGDYSQLCDLCSPTLSSLDIDLERRGYEAAQWLDRVLQGEAAPKEPHLIPPAFVVERRSTDVYAFEDEDVAKALRFIRDHASETIKAGDVVAATTISRRSLEGRFNLLVGATLHDEIWRAHTDLAQRLLTSSSLSLQEVAERSGFRTASALVSHFRKKFGITPKEYRNANRG
ncbi:DNA-binding transcriptional regulator [Luteolibacter ambystomatis]|uniref:DNA-binding transcriptional regulator n=1 Tax=Luteolibacter ambystomatis TaxID=2824561 RepID=A0A975G5R8_9BACT|nr:DNA-binding transcriptional regulator [Luteolibacter ambystomatis]QUE49312.1 DNA-binding transcriptional regulator [Luteolibacter ambystomatis]